MIPVGTTTYICNALLSPVFFYLLVEAFSPELFFFLSKI